MEPGASKDGLEANAGGRDAALSTRSLQRGGQLWPCETGCIGWRWSDCQNGASIWVGKSTWPTILESLKEAWKVVAQQ